MECPKCQLDNREGAKFCSKCGHKFEILCPECETKTQAGNSFCDECGYNFQPPKETSIEISGDTYRCGKNRLSAN